jgi:hypothetical protein
MAAVAGSSGGGGRKGSNDPTKKKKPEDKPVDDDEEEDGSEGGRRIQCTTCLRWVAASTGLEAHQPHCVGERDWQGDFLCLYPGCGATSPYYGDLIRHFRTQHPGRDIPKKMTEYLR